jgi:hypothetical protein
MLSFHGNRAEFADQLARGSGGVVDLPTAPLGQQVDIKLRLGNKNETQTLRAAFSASPEMPSRRSSSANTCASAISFAPSSTSR